MQVLLPDGLVGAIGGADVGDLLRAQAQLGVQELDQHGVARQQLQQYEGGGESRPQHQGGLCDAAKQIVARHGRFLCQRLASQVL
ncbi:hypothetical protein SDC9_195871 [bioreactor metagenome]|uniref:Uncharacterized protein n=1 Tax=bioreactor metagenome TaxID=1076179 RepID=A0A645IAH3_9ZZZZ